MSNLPSVIKKDEPKFEIVKPVTIYDVIESFRSKFNVAMFASISVCYVCILTYKLIESHSKNYPRKKKKKTRKECVEQISKLENQVESLKLMLIKGNVLINNL